MVISASQMIQWVLFVSEREGIEDCNNLSLS